MNDDKITNILVCGIGGQGVMTAADILAEAALRQGWDVKKTEVAGMAQRGGVVTSHVRFGRKVLSPQIGPGQADILLGFEIAEALRWANYVRRGGLAVVNTSRFVPPVVTGGLFEYPADPVRQMRRLGLEVHAFDAAATALALGDLRLGNTVMLGAIAEHLPFPADVLLECVIERFRKRKPKLVEANRRAFADGRAADALSAPAPAASQPV